MKQLLSLLLVVAMLFTFAACGEDNDGTDKTTTTTAPAGETDPTNATTTGSIEGNATVNQPTTTGSLSNVTQNNQQQSNTTQTQATTTKAQQFKARYYSRYKDFMTLRDGLKNTAYKMAVDQEISIAFMGGSVSAGMGDSNKAGGWRGRLITALKSDMRYNMLLTAHNFTLGGNGSQYGTYMVDEFVVPQKPDLVFIEYAVNSAYDGYTEAVYLWSHYETMIQKIRKANPYADIVLVYVSDENNRSKDIIPELEKIADKYKLPSINLYEVLQDKIASGYSWSSVYSDGVHPAERGYIVMQEAVHGLIESAMIEQNKTYQKKTTPAATSPYVKNNAKMVLTSKLSTLPSGWSKSTTFPQNQFGGCIRTSDSTKILTIKFKGTDFGVLAAFGESYGKLEYQIDNQPAQTLNCYLTYDNPKARMLYENGTDGEHTIKLRLQSEPADIAIAAFLINGSIISIQ